MGKMKIVVGSVVTAKVGEMENNKREGRIRRTRNEVVGCVKAVVGNKNYQIQFEDGHAK